jgi:hypothetical protein
MHILSVCAHTVSFQQVEVDTNSLWIISKKESSRCCPSTLPYRGSFCTLYLSNNLIKHHGIRLCRLTGHNPLFIILSSNILSKAATEDLQGDQFLDPTETTQMNFPVLYAVQRILSMLAWFMSQKCFHVKYNLSNLFSICHHTPTFA